jgi:GT2 family glycosyltransferase
MKVSIIIVCFNGRQFVSDCISSLLDSDYPNFEVIFIDNGSTDRSYELVKTKYSSVKNLKVIRISNNLGVAAARNLGYKMSNGEIIVFLDVDTIVSKSVLSELIKAFYSNRKVGIVQCKLMQKDVPNKVDSIGQSIDRVGYGYPDHLFLETNKLATQREIFYADGAAFAIRREVAEEVKILGEVFDSDYFPLYYEDIDLSWRVRLRGYSVVIQPTALVYHKRTASNFCKLKELYMRSHSRNRFFTLMKNYSTKNLFKYLPLLFFLEFLKSIILLRICPRHSIATLMSFIDCIIGCKKIWRKRYIVQSRLRRVSDSEILNKMNRVSLRKLYLTFKALYKEPMSKTPTSV